MYQQIRLPLACLLVMLYCFWYYSRKKHLATRASRAFNILVVFTVINLAASTITEYTVHNRDIIPDELNFVLHSIFVMSITAWCGSFLMYLLQLLERDGGGNHSRGKIVTITLCTVIMIAQMFLPIEYLDTPNGSTSFGPKAYAVYLVVAYMLISLLYLTIRYRSLIGHDNFTVILASTVIFIIGACIQITVPYVLLTSPGICMIMLGLMVNMEDAHLYLSVRTGLYNDLACRKIVQERLSAGEAVEIGFYKFFGDETRIYEAMKSIDEQLSNQSKFLMCGLYAPDTLLVLPLSKVGELVRVPETLPAPHFADGSGEEFVQYRTDVLQFDHPENYDYIEHVLNEMRSRLNAENLQTDELTALLRRGAFISLVNGKIERGEQFAFLILDLDNMKTINDTLGHSLGDDALRSVADVFRASIRTSDIACRLGGDEFALLLNGGPGEINARTVVTRIRERLENPKYVPAELLGMLDLSVGVREYHPAEGHLAFTDIYEQADAALYDVKRNGKGSLAYFIVHEDGSSEIQRDFKSDASDSFTKFCKLP